MNKKLLLIILGAACWTTSRAATEVSGIYPHLAMFNNEGECGTGAVVPWADRLWVITYGPHLPKGSSDKLYEITPDLKQIIRPESIGGTPANRMIHRESQQLFIGPYAINAKGNVRTIPYSEMFGRHTGNARHLTDPAGKIYYATMEEGIYEVNTKNLAVKELFADEQVKKGRHADLPGYHGKGFYSGQGRLVYANNGEHGKDATSNPDATAGCLAEWDGNAEKWRIVRRNQFTEVTGPGGIYGNEHPDTDPIWSIGWDNRSLILMLLDGGKWHAYRLPKASHAYDGAHGWHTEWPRIRDIGEKDLLMTMHGMFWRFPRTFSAKNSAGVAPRSTYLKVIGDFCRWNDRVVFGCDDSAKNEFYNKRKAKGNLAAAGQSQSNLWFVKPEQLDRLGAPLGRGAVWLKEKVKANEPSDPFLFSGFTYRGVHLVADEPTTFTFEVDAQGNGEWTKLRDVEVKNYTWIDFPADQKGAWVRVRINRDCPKTTAFFQYANAYPETSDAPEIFNGVATTDDRNITKGLLHARGDNKRTLSVLTKDGYYELDGDLKLRRVNDPEAAQRVAKSAAIPRDVIVVDSASALYVDESGKRWRFPADADGVADQRAEREISTERDVFNCAGTFYELPANSSGGFGKIRPISTHNRPIQDFASYRGVFVISGISSNGAHIVHSDDGAAALWVGAFDDLWQFGKPSGDGGPWNNMEVKAERPSDPFLMTGFDKKSVTLATSCAAKIRIEVDITGKGDWYPWKTISVSSIMPSRYEFPEAFNAYWVRVVADRDCVATATFHYD